MPKVMMLGDFARGRGVMKTRHAVALAAVVSFTLGFVTIPVAYADAEITVAQAWWTVAGQQSQPSASMPSDAPHRSQSRRYRARPPLGEAH
jgi:hypothetical protein